MTFHDPAMIPLESTHDGEWTSGRDGVLRILTPLDRKVEFIVFADKTLVLVRSSMGYPALYPLRDARFEGPASAVLMDLDGTTVHSEGFWIWVIEQTTARLLSNPRFQLDDSDVPHVSGHSVSEHLQYCIEKYAPGAPLEEARRHYFAIVHHELSEITAGRGRENAFAPAPGLRDFLLGLKENGVRVGLVTSGLFEKAWPEILSVFRTLRLGDPLKYYDAIISAGTQVRKGVVGTLGELSPKPHPWLYAETARVGLDIDPANRHRVLCFEDSSAGVVSIRLAGFAAVAVPGGNIDRAGVGGLLTARVVDLSDALSLVTGK
jgi:beta-phosphoglucomutase-like phosphatase (HAD superfamily)